MDNASVMNDHHEGVKGYDRRDKRTEVKAPRNRDDTESEA